MIIGSTQFYWVQVGLNVILYLFIAVAIYCLLEQIPVRKKRWRVFRYTGGALSHRIVPRGLLTLMLVSGKAIEEKGQLLHGCGIQVEAALYETARRIMLLVLFIGIWAGYMDLRLGFAVSLINPVYVMLGSGIGSILVLFDTKLLIAMKEQRAHRIVKEIYIISHHLLYYQESKMNLHAKLSRCEPKTRTVRAAFHSMLNEWYHDAETAISAFKQRLGTDESYSFGETINALRLHEHEDYYGLLRQRIQDYKEKMELVRESRKETVSYMLFILAGLPILNTFRVFMYPWIVEGQRLFNSIN
ncbi:hypothetical protein [Paenibacillus hexagrammi]|uniref:Type II secretion system protein GspF domain-containing protein n=1 Tax=Paenibacillus hexagrammi TaxID=2908839 RepID=A0ABY3SH69_9BACL|nr:hypothetical protein [Paenibacillus sp. YPD9-1]UJF32544.1 hypothetical protein L0M14_23265 [Paenibacillus sp. YPD9-1]